jgi:hypothetical protein
MSSGSIPYTPLLNTVINSSESPLMYAERKLKIKLQESNEDSQIEKFGSDRVRTDSNEWLVSVLSKFYSPKISITDSIETFFDIDLFCDEIKKNNCHCLRNAILVQLMKTIETIIKNKKNINVQEKIKTEVSKFIYDFSHAANNILLKHLKNIQKKDPTVKKMYDLARSISKVVLEVCETCDYISTNPNFIETYISQNVMNETIETIAKQYKNRTKLYGTENEKVFKNIIDLFFNYSNTISCSTNGTSSSRISSSTTTKTKKSIEDIVRESKEKAEDTAHLLNYTNGNKIKTSSKKKKKI